MSRDPRHGSLARWAGWIRGHRRLVVGAWIAAVIVAMAAAHSAGTRYTNDLSLRGNMRVVKLFGLSLATAVFLDAFVVRSLLLPSVLALFGERTWKLPKVLDRRLQRIAINPDEDEAVLDGSSRPRIGPLSEEPA